MYTRKASRGQDILLTFLTCGVIGRDDVKRKQGNQEDSHSY